MWFDEVVLCMRIYFEYNINYLKELNAQEVKLARAVICLRGFHKLALIHS